MHLPPGPGLLAQAREFREGVSEEGGPAGCLVCGLQQARCCLPSTGSRQENPLEPDFKHENLDRGYIWLSKLIFTSVWSPLTCNPLRKLGTYAWKADDSYVSPDRSPGLRTAHWASRSGRGLAFTQVLVTQDPGCGFLRPVQEPHRLPTKRRM